MPHCRYRMRDPQKKYKNPIKIQIAFGSNIFGLESQRA